MVPGGGSTKQPAWKLVIDAPGPASEPSVSIVATAKGGKQIATHVKIGDSFTVTNSGKKLPADFGVRIVADHNDASEGNGSRDATAWQVKFHSSCSHGLEIGDK